MLLGLRDFKGCTSENPQTFPDGDRNAEFNSLVDYGWRAVQQPVLQRILQSITLGLSEPVCHNPSFRGLAGLKDYPCGRGVAVQSTTQRQSCVGTGRRELASASGASKSSYHRRSESDAHREKMLLKSRCVARLLVIPRR